MPDDGTLLELADVSRAYDDGAVQALRGISLAVRKGEFLSIVGPSGSGKSSLLHLMAGFDRPTGGVIRWKGRAMERRRDWTDIRRGEVGVVFQEFLLLPTLTAAENVEIAMSGTGRPAAEQKGRARDLLDRVGLGARLGHLPHALSGGERQRVAIARSIANEPELLLCDEPTGNLDSVNAEAVTQLLMSIRREKGVTLVLVTHDRELAARGDRQVRIVDGQVAAP